MSIFIFAKNRPDINYICAHLNTPRLTRFDGDTFFHRNSPVDLHKGDIVIIWPTHHTSAAQFEAEISELENGAQIVPAYNFGTAYNHRVGSSLHFSCAPIRYLKDAGPSTQVLACSPRANLSFVSNFLNPDKSSEYCMDVYDFTEEYRVLTFFGSTVMCGKKVPVDPVYHPSIRSHKLGWGVQWGNILNKDPDYKLNSVVNAISKRQGKTGIVAVDFGVVDKKKASIPSIVTKITSYHPIPNALVGKVYASKIKRWSLTQTLKDIPEIVTTFMFDDEVAPAVVPPGPAPVHAYRAHFAEIPRAHNAVDAFAVQLRDVLQRDAERAAMIPAQPAAPIQRRPPPFVPAPPPPFDARRNWFEVAEDINNEPYHAGER